jgi:hypothetical protein
MNKSSGILRNKECHKMFEKINIRPWCNDCNKERSNFESKNKKHGSYSNLIPGFSSIEINIPIDILIVADAHGGGRKEDFRNQKDLEYEVNYISSYYLHEKLTKFHQQQMRELFYELDNLNKSWVFTDLIKCFVWSGNKDNIEIAIKYCKEYLDMQIASLNPKKILVLGKRVAENCFNLQPKTLIHGNEYPFKVKNREIPILWSYFPSRNTADIWTEKNMWKPVINNFR